MNEQFVFNLNSVVVDDLASGKVYEAIGLPKVWEGEHPFFKTRGAAYATGKGGILLLQAAADAHRAVSRFTGAKERHFHVQLLVQDLGKQRSVAKASPFCGELSDDYQGPFGKSFSVQLKIAGGHEFWFEFTEGHQNLVAREESAFVCVDSTAMVAAKRDELIKPFESLGIMTDKRAADGYFKVLEGINQVAMLQDWHYLEVNEPTKSDGVMQKFVERMGRPGIFGTNFVPRNMDNFVAVAERAGVDTNTKKPILLMVSVKDKEYKCADIITMNPRGTGGARVFILTPLEYPWELVK